MSEYRQVMIQPHERQRFDAMVRARVLDVAGPVHERDGVLYATVRRSVAPRVYRSERAARSAWVRPVCVVGGLAACGVGVFALVAHLVRTMTTAVSQAGPALGFMLALSVVLFLAVALRRRAGRTVTVTTVTTTRVRVR